MTVYQLYAHDHDGDESYGVYSTYTKAHEAKELLGIAAKIIEHRIDPDPSQFIYYKAVFNNSHYPEITTIVTCYQEFMTEPTYLRHNPDCFKKGIVVNWAYGRTPQEAIRIGVQERIQLLQKLGERND